MLFVCVVIMLVCERLRLPVCFFCMLWSQIFSNNYKFQLFKIFILKKLDNPTFNFPLMLILDWERPFSCSWTLFVMSMSEVFSIMNHWINGVCKEHLWTWGEWFCVIFGFKLHCILLIYTQRKKLSTSCFFEMTNDTTSITRLLTW